VRLEEEEEKEEQKVLDSFIYALESDESQQQYLIRLRYFFNFLNLGDSGSSGSGNKPITEQQQQAVIFLNKAK
jgi:hypothetical protein